MTPAWVRDRRMVSWLLVLATLLTCLPAILSASFHFDDVHCIVQNPAVRTLSNVPLFFGDAQLFSAERGNIMYRPVMMATFALDHAAWGYTAAGWMLTNAIVHAAVVVLTYRLALRLGLSELAALFAGAVFALHPALSEVQNYASSRSESLAALFTLAALHAYLSARGSAGGRRAAWIAGTGAFFVLAMMSKETPALLCGAIAGLELVCARRDGGKQFVRAIVPVAVVGGLLIAMFLLRRAMLGVAVAELNFATVAPGTDAQYGGGRTVIANFLTQSRVVVLYFKMLLWPAGLNVDHDAAIVSSMTATVALAFAIHAAVVAWAFSAALRGARLFPLCVGWFYLFLAPSIVIPLNVVMNEHRMYLPMIAVALLSGAALARVAELLTQRLGAGRTAAAMTVPFVCFAALYTQRSLEWKDDETLWTIAVERAPRSARAHMNHGAALHTRANETFDRDARVALIDSALASYSRSEKLHSTRADLWVDIGNAWFTRAQALHRREDFEKALAAYDRFGDLVGRDAPRTRLLRAAALAELGDPDGAVALVEAVKTEAKDDSPLYDTLIAHALRRKGDKDGAAAAMERVIARTEPLDEIDGLLELGWWCFEDGLELARTRGLQAAQATLQRAEGYLQRALTISKRTRDKRAPLYVARFLTLLGQPGADEFERMALSPAYRWTAPPEEAAWVRGGMTPGVFSAGTGSPRVR